MIVSVPLLTCGTLPETGVSSICAPGASSRTRVASRRLVLGVIVLRSAHSFPVLKPAMMPSSPEATVSSTSSLGSELITTSASSASSRGVSAHFKPSSMSDCAASRLRLSP